MPKKLFILNIDLGNNNFQKLAFNYGDIPEETAFLFCQEYGLDTKAYEFVVYNLKEKLRIVAQQQEQEELDQKEDPDDQREEGHYQQEDPEAYQDAGFTDAIMRNYQNRAHPTHEPEFSPEIQGHEPQSYPRTKDFSAPQKKPRSSSKIKTASKKTDAAPGQQKTNLYAGQTQKPGPPKKPAKPLQTTNKKLQNHNNTKSQPFSTNSENFNSYGLQANPPKPKYFTGAKRGNPKNPNPFPDEFNSNLFNDPIFAGAKNTKNRSQELGGQSVGDENFGKKDLKKKRRQNVNTGAGMRSGSKNRRGKSGANKSVEMGGGANGLMHHNE
jgi:hypothetical protein